MTHGEFKDCLKDMGKRLILANIPIVGTSLDVVYTSLVQYRNDQFIKNTLEELGDSKIDEKYFETLEFKNIFIKTWKIVINEVYEDKISYYSKLIKDSLVSNEIDRKYNFEFIKLISELSVEQMLILKELYIQQKEILDYPSENIGAIILNETDYNDLPAILKEKYSIKEDDFEFLAKRTESTGLIQGIMYYSNGEFGGNIYKIDPILSKLMKKLDMID